ncbi:MAG TPA: site-specific DNA-methyltransferase [Flavobacterium sp.]|nr:site-specific DNA-methyltransferase [Flavobacterium sp.]
MNKQDLISKIKQLDGVTQDERAYLINLVNTKKKYGLVWEDKPEDVEEQLRDNLPVLKEVKDKAIINGEDNPNHILIEGDNLHALTALTFTHEGKIDVIYIDPPYNTGNKDFKYNDTFVDKEDSYRHSKWLSFMDKRLRIAKRLLSETGGVFISIDDNEHAQLKMLCDEVFGAENYRNSIAVRRGAKSVQSQFENIDKLGIAYEYLLLYTKNSNYRLNQFYFDLEEKRTGSWNNHWRGTDRPTMRYEIFGKTPERGQYRWAKERSLKAIQNFEKLLDELETDNPTQKQIDEWYLKENNQVDLLRLSKTNKPEHYVPPTDTKFGHNLWTDLQISGTSYLTNLDITTFNNPKNPEIIKRIAKWFSNSSATILDFFAGSGTTLHAAMALNAKDGGNRQCILVTNNENNICEEVTYERNKRVIRGYTNDKGVVFEGLKNNNLRYFKSEYVSRTKSLKNKKELTRLATELLCIKENCYNEVTTQYGVKNWTAIFESPIKQLIVIYDDLMIEESIEIIKKLKENQQTDNRIKVYVFSNGQYPYTEDFEEVANFVELCALPDAIYKAYQNVLPKTKREIVPTLDDDEATDENLFNQSNS